MRKLWPLGLFLTLSLYASATCNQESKNLVDCLQCCGDTVLTQAFVFKSKLNIAALKKMCESNPSGEPFLYLYQKKYEEFDATLASTICRYTNVLEAASKETNPNTYGSCANACGQIYRVKK